MSNSYPTYDLSGTVEAQLIYRNEFMHVAQALIIVSIVLSLSLLINAFLLYYHYKQRSKAKPISPKDDMRLLSDLMSNNRTLIEIRRIAPQEYFIRRS